MPMHPLCKRDWTTTAQLDIKHQGATVSWPPRNWREMDSDVKLMTVEYVAMFLALKKEFPRLGQRALLQKYHCHLKIVGENVTGKKAS
ncbi:hypothetical protein DPMN_055244 [Dreissena polymorpha]|uniref:Uncharacterized protein n=1 Tax=Dreissena polymorpha TaxID=45954 RepID=A0A9D4CRF5_DREPO|nr:hypothetical protein DPMN_055244 [Dreissena polymorpha]